MLVSRKRARIVSSAMLLLGFAFVVLFNAWWPGILLTIGLSFAIRNFLLCQWYDLLWNLAVFGGIFAFIHLRIHFTLSYIIPVFLCIGAIYLLFKEFFLDPQTEAQKEEELNQEIAEDD